MIRNKGQSKFNVSLNKKRDISYEDIVFDSKVERSFYTDVVLPNYNAGKITYFELQKTYILQDKFKHNGKTIRAIKYVVDFYLECANGEIYVVDVKGFPDSVAKIKRKMFWAKFPELNFIWVSYTRKTGWIEKN